MPRRTESDKGAEPADDQPGPLAGLIPPDPLMAGPWYGSVRYAMSRDDVMQAFERESGLKFRPLGSILDRMIDQATGADLAYLRAFLAWHNENIWGDINLRAGEVDEVEDDL